MMPLELPLGQTKNPASEKLFLHRVAPKEMHCSCTARKSNGDACHSNYEQARQKEATTRDHIKTAVTEVELPCKSGDQIRRSRSSAHSTESKKKRLFAPLEVS